MSAFLLQRELSHGFLFRVGELAERVDRLSAVPFAVFDAFGGSHHCHVHLTVTGADVIPVDEVGCVRIRPRRARRP